ncbi:MAG: PQQ-binding-like beta-propeller repeat protein [Deltaproteobacteria bacterium]|nr:PQQ-binding-like beta-propeller repeat protein [Deltaproteobacteria bacterium]
MNTLNCPQCGAAMAIDAEKREARCGQCGEVRKLELVTEGSDQRAREALGAPPFALKLMVAGVLIAAAMFPVLRWWEQQIKPRSSKAEAPVAPATMAWDVTFPPLLRDLNGDGVQDVIGRFRPLDEAQPTMRVGAFDGATLKPLWTTGSLGDWADGLGSVQLALTGNALLITDAHGGVEVRDASIGGVSKRFALPGVASQACASPDGTVKFFVVTQGDQGAMVEDSVPQPTPGSRPAWCPRPAASAGPQAHQLSAKSAPDVPGLATSLVLNEGTNAVALGLESGLPTLVGFDPSRPGVRWKQPVTLENDQVRKEVPLGADLVAGIVYVPYQVAAGRRLLAVEASSGQRRWDIAIPGQGLGTAPWERIVATGSRVFVPGPLGLAVFDAQTGKPLGRLGS